jgi:beta-galactosidase
LCYVLVEAVDKSGNLCPLATNIVTCRIQGAGHIAGVGNGDHHFPAEFDTNRVSLFFGKAMIILRTIGGQSGSIRVEANAVGLTLARTLVRCR